MFKYGLMAGLLIINSTAAQAAVSQPSAPQAPAQTSQRPAQAYQGSTQTYQGATSQMQPQPQQVLPQQQPAATPQAGQTAAAQGQQGLTTKTTLLNQVGQILESRYCAQNSPMLTSLKLTTGACQAAMQSASNQCVKQITPQMPDVLNSQQEITHWSAQYGDCLGKAFVANVQALKKPQ